MKKKYIIFSVIFLVIIASTLGFYFLKKSISTNAKAGSIALYTIPTADKVFINGTITPMENESIYLDPSKGNVDKVSVKNGQSVKKDSTLFTYKNDQITDQISQIKNQIDTAKKQKKRAQDDQADLKKKVDEAKNQNNPAAGVPEVSGYESQIAQLQTSIDNLQDQISSLQNQLNSLTGKEYTTVKAPIDGEVTLNEDAKVMNGPYITIESTSFYVKGSINEKELPKLKENQTADILILSTNNVVSGKITSIENRPEAQAPSVNAVAAGDSNISNYEVDLTFASQEGLTDGFHVQATVNIDDNTIKIPMKAVIEENGKKYVFKAVNKKLTKQEITTADSSASEVIVTSGLKEEDTIAASPTADMKEGMPVE